jgi:tetraacyldisaccharide 4'-kinase
VQHWLNNIWYRGGAGAALLQPLALLYGAAVSRRRKAYSSGKRRAIHIGVPVIIVGNLTVGGTGKTPLVAWLAQQLSKRAWRPGIVSRGYGSRAAAAREVSESSPWEEVGDEPLLLKQRTELPVFVGRDRVAAACELVKRGVDVIVSDDGLQHLRLARDCEIVVVDGTRGFGNGRLLPAGPLRELPERMRNADAIVINGASSNAAAVQWSGLYDYSVRMELIPEEVRALMRNPQVVIAPEDERLTSASRQPLEAFRGQRVHALAGIGNPERFFGTLRAAGIHVIEHPFPDHHAYRARELRFGDGQPVLMTEKDAVKCRAFAEPGMWYVPVGARFSENDAEVLLERVTNAIRNKPNPGVKPGDTAGSGMKG